MQRTREKKRKKYVQYFISNVPVFESNSPPFSTALRSRLTTSGSDELAQSLETKKKERKKEKEKKKREKRGVNDRFPSREPLITSEAVKPLRRGNRRNLEALESCAGTIGRHRA